MRYRTLGRTGLSVSVLAFGAGPVSGLMTGDDAEAQQAVLARAIELGINWVDTAPGYGHGASETNLGRALGHLNGSSSVHVATKVRLIDEQMSDLTGAVERSVEASLQRLGRTSVTLLQLHNGLTRKRGDEPFSLSVGDVLGPGGVGEALGRVKQAGLVRHIGLTGTGHPEAMRAVVRSGLFDTMQVPFNLLNPSAGAVMPSSFAETNYGNILADCAALDLGVFAIRVFAGGALLGQEASAHTHRTPFFPLALYERDRAHAAEMGKGDSLRDTALRFVLARADVHSAIVGFGAPAHVDEAANIFRSDPSTGR